MCGLKQLHSDSPTPQEQVTAPHPSIGACRCCSPCLPWLHPLYPPHFPHTHVYGMGVQVLVLRLKTLGTVEERVVQVAADKALLADRSITGEQLP